MDKQFEFDPSKHRTLSGTADLLDQARNLTEPVFSRPSRHSAADLIWVDRYGLPIDASFHGKVFADDREEAMAKLMVLQHTFGSPIVRWNAQDHAAGFYGDPNDPSISGSRTGWVVQRNSRSRQYPSKQIHMPFAPSDTPLDRFLEQDDGSDTPVQQQKDTDGLYQEAAKVLVRASGDPTPFHNIPEATGAPQRRAEQGQPAQPNFHFTQFGTHLLPELEGEDVSWPSNFLTSLHQRTNDAPLTPQTHINKDGIQRPILQVRTAQADFPLVTFQRRQTPPELSESDIQHLANYYTQIEEREEQFRQWHATEAEASRLARIRREPQMRSEERPVLEGRNGR